MSKESKFGYGFLLAGVGLPYLIERLFGQAWAAWVAGLCLLLGVFFLVWGHLHERRGLAVKITWIVVAVVLIGVSVAWRLYRPKPELQGSAVPQPKQPVPEAVIPPTGSTVSPPETAKAQSKRNMRPNVKPQSKPSNQPSEGPILLSATFSDPQSPVLVVSNSSARVAEAVTWAMVSFRTSDLSYCGFVNQSIGYVKAHSVSARYSLDLPTIAKRCDGDAQIKDGDELTGSISVDCPQCEIRTYIVHFVWGDAGWFFESKQKGGYIVPGDMSKEGRTKYIQLFTGETFAKDRIEMKPTLQ